MTDRELLELAAKAAGYKWREDIAKYRNERDIVGLWIIDPTITGWNPLTDDGDAMRLAVKLGMCVEVLSDQKVVFVDALYIIELPLGDDPYAATRRAIVRAAAEIGKELQ